MPRLSINLLGWNHRQHIGNVIDHVRAQTFRDFELVYTDNASADGSADFVRHNYPDVRVVPNAENLGFSGGHNRFLESATSELVMVLNPDVALAPNFLEAAIKAFADPKVGAVTGKMIREYVNGKGILDGTGIIVDSFRRGRDRGQNEVDTGQYDAQPRIFGVTGAAAIYRRQALEDAKVPIAGGRYEYFDEDFFAYWEDLDLSWRLRLMGWACRYVPAAQAVHPRKAGSNPGGYKKFISFVKHHRALPPKIRKWNWRNHLFCIIKNDFGWPFWRDLPLILLRETAMLVYILFFETTTLAAVPEFCRLLPKEWTKRRSIQERKKVTASEAATWFEL